MDFVVLSLHLSASTADGASGTVVVFYFPTLRSARHLALLEGTGYWWSPTACQCWFQVLCAPAWSACSDRLGASEHQAVAGRLHNCTAVSQTPANWKRCRLMWHERSWSAENNACYNAFRRNGLLWISCIFFGRSPVSWRTGSRETIFWLLTAFLQ